LYWVLLYVAVSENQKPGHMAICEGIIKKIFEINDTVTWAVVIHGQKRMFVQNVTNEGGE